MKKVFVIAISVIFIYNLMGYFAIFQVMKYKAKKEIKKAIKAKLPASELTIIAISESNQHELNWYEDGKEFRYQGMMFDIVLTEKKGNITYYHCINDKQEEQLFAHLSEHITKHVSNDLSKNSNKKNILQKLIMDYIFISILSFNEIQSKNISYFYYNDLLKSFPLKIPFTPPETLS